MRHDVKHDFFVRMKGSLYGDTVGAIHTWRLLSFAPARLGCLAESLRGRACEMLVMMDNYISGHVHCATLPHVEANLTEKGLLELQRIA